MDQYLPISIIGTRGGANKACEKLENAGVPIMLQFIEVEEAGEKISAYRLLVPMEFREASLTLLGITADGSVIEQLNAKAA